MEDARCEQEPKVLYIHVLSFSPVALRPNEGQVLLILDVSRSAFLNLCETAAW